MAGSFFNHRVGKIFPGHGTPGQKVRVSSKQNICTAASHVGGDGHGAEPTGLSDNFSFALVVAGIQNIVPDSFAHKEARKQFGLLDGNGADQDRLPRLVDFFYLFQQRLVFTLLSPVDCVRRVKTNHGHIGGNADHIQVIDLPEFIFFRQGCTCHPRQFFIHTKVILESNGRKRFVLVLDLDAFFRLDGLVQPVAVAPAEHKASCEVIDDDNLAVLDNVILVNVHGTVRFQCVRDVMVDLIVFLIGQVLNTEVILCPFDAASGQD